MHRVPVTVHSLYGTVLQQTEHVPSVVKLDGPALGECLKLLMLQLASRPYRAPAQTGSA